MSIPPSRRRGTAQRQPSLSVVFDLPCSCGAQSWVLLITTPPTDDGRRRTYGCRCCGARIDTLEVEATPVTPEQPQQSRNVTVSDAPCPQCGCERLVRYNYPAYDALAARKYVCRTCRHEWQTAEVLTSGPRAKLPLSARRAARKHALGRGGL